MIDMPIIAHEATIARGSLVEHAMCAENMTEWAQVSPLGPAISGYISGSEIRLAPWVCKSATRTPKASRFDAEAPYAVLTIAYQTCFLDGYRPETPQLAHDAKLRATKIMIALHWPKAVRDQLKRINTGEG